MNFLSRRSFLRSSAAAALAVKPGAAALAASGLWNAPPSGAFRCANLNLGYHAITWGTEHQKAIEEIATTGFKGIQLRTDALKDFGDKPAALKQDLAKYHLQFVAFSSGTVYVDRPTDDHVEHAKFVRDAGGMYLQVTDSRPKGREVTAEDCKRMGGVLTDLGKKVSDIGLKLGYHNHMGTLGQSPSEIDQVLGAADPAYVHLELDIAHYTQGGGDPAAAVRKYHDRILFLHLKDVRPKPGQDTHGSYQFVELGQGRVDLPAVFQALGEVNFKGWAIVELDGPTSPDRTPLQSALISKEYLVKTAGCSI